MAVFKKILACQLDQDDEFDLAGIKCRVTRIENYAIGTVGSQPDQSIITFSPVWEFRTYLLVVNMDMIFKVYNRPDKD